MPSSNPNQVCPYVSWIYVATMPRPLSPSIVRMFVSSPASHALNRAFRPPGFRNGRSPQIVDSIGPPQVSSPFVRPLSPNSRNYRLEFRLQTRRIGRFVQESAPEFFIIFKIRSFRINELSIFSIYMIIGYLGRRGVGFL